MIIHYPLHWYPAPIAGHTASIHATSWRNNHHGVVFFRILNIFSMLLARAFHQRHPSSFRHLLCTWHVKFHMSSVIVWERRNGPQTTSANTSINYSIKLSMRKDYWKSPNLISMCTAHPITKLLYVTREVWIVPVRNSLSASDLMNSIMSYLVYYPP